MATSSGLTRPAHNKGVRRVINWPTSQITPRRIVTPQNSSTTRMSVPPLNSQPVAKIAQRQLLSNFHQRHPARLAQTFRREFRSTSGAMTSTTEHSNVTMRLSSPLPAGTIDCHTHIIPPDFGRFPILPTAQYKPTPHTLSDARQFYAQQSGLGISAPRMVLTQVSVYGTDNSALLSGLSELGSNGRGVVECDPKRVSLKQLQEWWEKGIRGVRINLVSVSRSVTEAEMQETLQAYVKKLAQMKMPDRDKKWVVEMYLPLKSMPMLLHVLPKLHHAHDVRWCIDHFGGLKFKDDAPEFGPDDDPHLIPGFTELVQLVTDKDLPEVYLKLSAAYRIETSYPSKDALRRLDPVGRVLVDKAEDRMIWASDWPHTRFEGIDSVPFVEMCYSWCGESTRGQSRREKLFRANSARLWDMK